MPESRLDRAAAGKAPPFAKVCQSRRPFQWRFLLGRASVSCFRSTARALAPPPNAWKATAEPACGQSTGLLQQRLKVQHILCSIAATPHHEGSAILAKLQAHQGARAWHGYRPEARQRLHTPFREGDLVSNQSPKSQHPQKNRNLRSFDDASAFDSADASSVCI